MYFPIKFTSFDKKNIAIFSSRYEIKFISIMRDNTRCMRGKLYYTQSLSYWTKVRGLILLKMFV